MDARFQELLQILLKTCAELRHLTGRPFTLDGHTVGAAGEVWAQSEYDIVLANNPVARGRDATWRKKGVQIKTTQKGPVKINLQNKESPWLLVIHLHDDGSFHERYNGDLATLARQRPGLASARFSLARLDDLNKLVKVPIPKRRA